MTTIATLGQAGSLDWEAAHSFRPGAELISFPNTSALIKAFGSGMAWRMASPAPRVAICDMAIPCWVPAVLGRVLVLPERPVACAVRGVRVELDLLGQREAGEPDASDKLHDGADAAAR